MKRNLSCLAVIAVLSSPLSVSAGGINNPFNQFQNYAQANLIAPFARDLGGVLGAASVEPDKSYGLLGFSVGLDGAMQFRPASNDLIMKSAGVKEFGLPLLHAAVGLPYGVDLTVRGLQAEGVTVYGGGLRYGLYKSSTLTPFLPSVVVAGNGNGVSAFGFNATHYSFDSTASWDLPFVNPFIGAGYDHTTVKVVQATSAGAVGATAGADGSRFEVGADIKPFPFVRVRGAYLIMHGIPGALANIGISF